MNTQIDKNKKTWLKIVTGIVVAGLIVALIPMGAVQADSLNQEDPPPSAGDRGKGTAILEKILQREQKVNENLESLFDKADKIIARLEDAIQNGQTNGKDVSALIDALDEINDQITSAHAKYDKATGLLNNHSGFNDGGKVTDTKLARETIHEVGKYQREARRLIADSIKDTVKAIRLCHGDNSSE